MIPTLDINAQRISVRLDSIPAAVRQALTRELRGVEEVIAADARARAAAHHTYDGTKPGDYVNSIRGGVSTRGGAQIIGYVRSANPLAHLMEWGVNAHLELPKDAGQVMAFLANGEQVFARSVVQPGMPAFPAIFPAFQSAEGSIEALLTSAGLEAAQNAGAE